MAHTTTWVPKGCLVDLYGEVDGAELAAINNELLGSEKFDDLKFFVRDTTKITKIAVTPDDAIETAYIDHSASDYKNYLRCAFVAGEGKVKELLNVFAKNLK